ncbi:MULTISPECIES: hypothetical protein [unclassified Caulobacter]|uniref:hypothetical protein n=1 Tax=unclassified Caulobacter TaxID=2648921 RepID=UPI0006FAC1EA|nr:MULTISPECIES: hypothetical protein [unclassified Caulobacter]KQV62663.1 hypothetical protein ASC62_03755 [Caulobacter sp. Root342]KQV71796.1 hypothetical protein ASC70_23030 [Caulobacter sp. Root343]
MRRRVPFLALSLTLILAGAARAGETACWFENGAIIAPAVIADMAGDYVIDLSAPRTLLHETRAQMAGIIEPELTLSVEVAGLKAPAVSVKVADLDARGAGFVTPIAGVIGMDVLAGHSVEIDFAACRVRIDQAWRARRQVVLPVVVVDGLPTIEAAVSDGPTALRGAFAIDTASLAMARLSTRGAAATGKLDLTARHKAPAHLRALSIGGVLAENVPASLADDLPEGVAGTLGTGFWARHRLRLAADARTLSVAP